jgi:hypothetical protein
LIDAGTIAPRRGIYGADSIRKSGIAPKFSIGTSIGLPRAD